MPPRRRELLYGIAGACLLAVWLAAGLALRGRTPTAPATRPPDAADASPGPPDADPQPGGSGLPVPPIDAWSLRESVPPPRPAAPQPPALPPRTPGPPGTEHLDFAHAVLPKMPLPSVEELAEHGTPPNASLLPPMAWVVTATFSYILRHSYLLPHAACYSALRNLPFYLLPYAEDHEAPLDSLPMKLAPIIPLLPKFRWLLFTDADTIVADSRADIFRSFAAPEELLGPLGADVVFPDRDNGELCSCSFLVRNSPGGRAFLRAWYGWWGDPALAGRAGTGTDDGMGGDLQGERPRYRNGRIGDQGDLLELVLSAAGLGGWTPVPDAARAPDPRWPFRMQALHASGFPSGDDALPSPASPVPVPLLPFQPPGSEKGNLTICSNAFHPSASTSAFLACSRAALAPLRSASPRSPSYALDLRLPGGHRARLRAYKVFASWIRWADGRMRCRGDYTGYPWCRAVPGDAMLAGKGLHRFLGAGVMACGGEWTVAPRMGVREARGLLKGLGWEAYAGCWEEGEYVC